MTSLVVDWKEQWALYARDFRDGCAHIDLKPYGSSSILKLSPGAGFGDLSHPTTRLVLELLAPWALHRTVVDVGCGSGILSLAALLLGAKEALGIDIDEDALEHARSNSHLNGLEEKVTYSRELPERVLMAPLVLMNMIFSEQKEAWKCCQTSLPKNGEIITSGILKRERSRYLEQAKEWKWQLMDERQDEEWLGFIFKYL